MRNLSALVLAAAVAGLAACTPVATPAPQAAPASALPATSSPAAEPSPSAPVIACNDSYKRQVPSSRMLPRKMQLDEVCIGQDSDEEMLPKLCAASSPQPTDLRTLRHMVSERLSSGEAPTVYTQTVLVFASGGAAGYLEKLRAMLKSCPSHTTRDGVKITYSVADGPRVGDDSLSLKAAYTRTKPIEGMPPASVHRVVVARAGDHVSVIYDQGWEGAPSQDQTIFDAAAEGARLLSA